jgi:hypothetical protein
METTTAKFLKENGLLKNAMTVACRHTKPKNINGSMGNNESEEMYRE